MFDRRIDELFNLGESDDLVELSINFDELHAEYRPVEVDVLTPRQLAVKPGAYFEQAAYPAVKIDLPGRGFGDAREYFEQRRLSRPVATNNANDFARHYFEIDVFQRPKSAVFRFAIAIEQPEGGLRGADDRFTQGFIRDIARADTILFAQTLYPDNRPHTMSAKVRSTCLKW